MASFLLELTNNSEDLVGPAVTDEELAAYIEGQLDPVRKAQVSSYIANDADVYSRWLMLVENIDVVFPEAATEKPLMLSKAVDLLSKFLSLGAFKGFLVPSGVLGAFALFTFIHISVTDPINSLYRDFNDLNSLTSFLPTRSFDPLQVEKPMTEQMLLLQFGLHQGLIDLGIYEKSVLNENQAQVTLAQDKLDAKLAADYIDLGRWTAITQANCNQTLIPTEFVQQSSRVLIQLYERLLADKQSDVVTTLMQYNSKIGSDKICITAKALVDLTL